MNENNLIYPANERQELFGELTRTNRFVVEKSSLVYDIKQLPEGLFGIEHPETILRDDSKIGHFMEHGGVNLCHGSRNGGFRLPGLYSTKEPVALEPIIFGVGVLREVFTYEDSYETKTISDNVRTLFNFVTGYKYMEKDSKSEEKLLSARIALESTNIIYGDSIGELKQIKEREDDQTFLKAYLDVLNRAFKNIRVIISNGELPQISYNEYYISEMMRDLESYIAIAWLQHIELNKEWDEPPTSPEELIKRVNLLLDNIEVDESAKEVSTKLGYDAKLEETLSSMQNL